MPDPLDSFMAYARRVHLSSRQRNTGRERLLVFLRNDAPFDQRIIELAQEIGMSKKEKRARREAVEAFVYGEALQVEHSDQEGFFHALSLRVSAIVTSLAVLLVTGGGAAFAAEFALPGDVLYTVKVSIVEPIREQFAFTPEAKAEWTVQRVDRRMREAEKLARKGKFTPLNREVLQAHIEEHIVTFEEHLDTLSDEPSADSVEVHSALIDVVEQHEVLLPHDQSGALILTEIGRLMQSAINQVEEIPVPEVKHVIEQHNVSSAENSSEDTSSVSSSSSFNRDASSTASEPEIIKQSSAPSSSSPVPVSLSRSEGSQESQVEPEAPILTPAIPLEPEEEMLPVTPAPPRSSSSAPKTIPVEIEVKILLKGGSREEVLIEGQTEEELIPSELPVQVAPEQVPDKTVPSQPVIELPEKKLEEKPISTVEVSKKTTSATTTSSK